MGRNTAFGRPPVSERVRRWWEARSKTSRQNIFLALGVGGLFVAIVLAAVARDESSTTSRVISSRLQPTTTLALPTPSTVNIGDLGSTVTATDLFGLGTTSTTSTPPTTVRAPAPSSTRPPATLAPTTAPAPATTVTNPDIIFSTVPPPPTTATSQPQVTTTRPTTTTSPTTSTTAVAPLDVPGLLAPG